ncbi:hypothetical protein BCR42DRAFT_399915 [Absidia repens]|uniref:Uncharacterized protein n=1 Tax=Absidia repens TaxID=90262 RepID=A0A1X2J286_9FUNG|nr:hypothetical protein BCR42DRAFT_399915 [Absidia repens]
MILNEWFWAGVALIVVAYIYFDKKAEEVDLAKEKKYQQMKAASSGKDDTYVDKN